MAAEGSDVLPVETAAQSVPMEPETENVRRCGVDGQIVEGIRALSSEFEKRMALRRSDPRHLPETPMNPGTIAVVVGLMLGELIAAQTPPPAKRVLDLTSPEAVVTAPVVGSGGAVAVSGTPRLRLPLELRLLELDRQSFLLGGDVIYSVSLTNIGSASVDLPWSADREAVEVAEQPFMKATLVLLLMTNEGRPQPIGAAILDGTRRIPESIITL